VALVFHSNCSECGIDVTRGLESKQRSRRIDFAVSNFDIALDFKYKKRAPVEDNRAVLLA